MKVGLYTIIGCMPIAVVSAFQATIPIPLAVTGSFPRTNNLKSRELLVRRHAFLHPGGDLELPDVHFLSTHGPAIVASTSHVLTQNLKPLFEAVTPLFETAIQPLLNAYGGLLKEYPVETKSITAAILACGGDAIAQSRSEASTYDVKRGAAFLTFGALYTGAFQHTWFTFLNDHVAQWGVSLDLWGAPEIKAEWWRAFDLYTRFKGAGPAPLPPPSDSTLAAAKVAINQFGAVPFVYMPLFFAMTGALGNLNPQESWERARSLYFPLLKRNYIFWLPTQFFQFLVLPPDFQIPFLCCASLCWTVILSSVGGTASTSAPPSDAIQVEMTEPVLTMDTGTTSINDLTDHVSIDDLKNAAADIVPVGVFGAIEGAAGVVGDATVAGSVGLFASTAGDAAIAEAVGGAIAASEMGNALGAAFGASGQAEVGIAVVSVVSAGIGALVSARDNNLSSNVEDSVVNHEDNEGAYINSNTLV